MYRYEINYWDSFDHATLNEKGICAGKDYGDAANKLIEFYGKDYVIDIKLSEIEDILIDCEIKEFI